MDSWVKFIRGFVEADLLGTTKVLAEHRPPPSSLFSPTRNDKESVKT